MFVGIENDSTRDEPETTPELTGTPLAKTESMADFLVGLPQFVPVHPGVVPVKPQFVPE